MYLVTVKLPKNPNHDPHNKISGPCPIAPMNFCSDTTGEHHTFVSRLDSVMEIKEMYGNSYHITRIEGSNG